MSQVERGTEIEGVDVAGSSGAQSIVFVHGAMFTGETWALQRDALSDEFRVIAPDLSGHGVARILLGGALRASRTPCVLMTLRRRSSAARGFR